MLLTWLRSEVWAKEEDPGSESFDQSDKPVPPSLFLSLEHELKQKILNLDISVYPEI